MSIVDDFVSRTPAFAPAKPALGRQISAAFIAFFRALGGGWRAAIDYRRLCQLSDGRLKERGLSRTDLPRELHQRHFANLRGYLDIIG